VSRKLGIMLGAVLVHGLALLASLSWAGQPASEEEMELRLSLENLSVNSDYVTFDLRLDGAFASERDDALHKGFATHMTYTVELWRERGFWFDKLELTRTLTMKVSYDVWKERYVVTFRKDRVAKFDTLDEVRRATCNLEALKLIKAEELDPSEEYYIAARAHLRPLTIEEIGEIEDWLSGGPPSGEAGGGVLSIPGYLARALLGTTGITDRTAVAKSSHFSVEPVEETSGEAGSGESPPES